MRGRTQTKKTAKSRDREAASKADKSEDMADLNKMMQNVTISKEKPLPEVEVKMGRPTIESTELKDEFEIESSHHSERSDFSMSK